MQNNTGRRYESTSKEKLKVPGKAGVDKFRVWPNVIRCWNDLTKESKLCTNDTNVKKSIKSGHNPFPPQDTIEFIRRIPQKVSLIKMPNRGVSEKVLFLRTNQIHSLRTTQI